MPTTVLRDPVLAPSRVGEVIGGQWRLVARLGGGGMGEVYRAEHVTGARVVAIKLLRPELASSAMHARAVLREGEAAALVSHPNIVRIEDVGVDEKGAPYLVQEFLDGIDLATYAQYRRGPVPARDLIPLMLPIFDALGALHDAGVVHRDLKPENIFLVRDGSGWSPRLLDFGLAVIADHLDDEPRPARSDVALGSPAYMSPEQFRDPRHLTARSDLWSLGVMLYELLCGVMPFAGDDVAELARAVAGEDPIPLGRRVPGIAPSLADVVMSCLEKNPDDRPASVRELMAVLGSVQASLPPPAVEGDLAPTERHSAFPPKLEAPIAPAPLPTVHVREAEPEEALPVRTPSTELARGPSLTAVVLGMVLLAVAIVGWWVRSGR
jgi:serine/threonine protein kinase